MPAVGLDELRIAAGGPDGAGHRTTPLRRHYTILEPVHSAHGKSSESRSCRRVAAAAHRHRSRKPLGMARCKIPRAVAAHAQSGEVDARTVDGPRAHGGAKRGDHRIHCRRRAIRKRGRRGRAPVGIDPPMLLRALHRKYVAGESRAHRWSGHAVGEMAKRRHAIVAPLAGAVEEDDKRIARAVGHRRWRDQPVRQPHDGITASHGD